MSGFVRYELSEMPSLDHESLVLLFRNQPELAAQLLREALHVELPAYTEARLASSDLTEVVPAEFRADAVVLLVDGRPVLGVVVEAQLARDERKRFTWPVYISGLRARHECPVELLVLAPDRSVAAWASAPISLDLAAGCVIRPRVLGPETVPVVTDSERAAREPELALLSVIAHGGDDTETAVSIALAAAASLNHVPEEHRVLYLALIESALSDAAKKAFEMHPQAGKLISSWQRGSFEKGTAEGRVRGKAEAVLDVLDAREMTVTPEQRERILSCSDLDVLKAWLRRAATVATTDELFV